MPRVSYPKKSYLRKTLRSQRRRRQKLFRTIRARVKPRFSKFYLRSMNPFPYSRVVKLNYSDVITITPGALGYVAVHSFRANSIYDPDYTGGGHQPLFRDEMANIYDHYVVLGSRITCTFYSETASGVAIGVGGIKIDDNATIPTDMNTLLEHGSRLVKYRHMIANVNSTGVRHPTISMNYSTKKFFGLTNVKDNSAMVGATCGTNPTEEAYFNVFWGAPGSAAGEFNPVKVTVKIQYIVLFKELRDQTGS